MDDDTEVYRSWEDGFVVRRMRRNEIQQVMKWISSERPRFTPCELKCLLDMRADNANNIEGFYVGELNHQMVASIVVAPIADDLRYLGCLYVVERCRGFGFARRMLTVAHDVEDRRGFAGVMCLTAIADMEPVFEKFGYRTAAVKITGYQGLVSTDTKCYKYRNDIRQVIEKQMTFCHFLSVLDYEPQFYIYIYIYIYIQKLVRKTYAFFEIIDFK